MEAVTVGLAMEVAPSGIRANAIAPGTVYTDIHGVGSRKRPA
ncbi:MAG TPA: hypothetical protein VFF38_03715 [Microvirga sp.]|nr:hypothetical protein [Microvirga sp.]